MDPWKNRTQFVSRVLSLLIAVAACLTISGCGNGLAQVSGLVTIDGQPIHGGHGDVRVTVQFQPASGSGPTAIGLADENGAYTLATGSQNGIPPGEYLAICSASQLVPAKDKDGTPSGRRITDAKYANAMTSGLRFTVQPGRNVFNIPLESPPKNFLAVGRLVAIQ